MYHYVLLLSVSVDNIFFPHYIIYPYCMHMFIICFTCLYKLWHMKIICADVFRHWFPKKTEFNIFSQQFENLSFVKLTDGYFNLYCFFFLSISFAILNRDHLCLRNQQHQGWIEWKFILPELFDNRVTAFKGHNCMQVVCDNCCKINCRYNYNKIIHNSNSLQAVFVLSSLSYVLFRF